MIYTSVAAFLSDWKRETETTLRHMEAMTDESLSAAAGPEDRSLGRVAWHLVQSVGEMMGKTGLALEAEEGPVPASAAAITAAHGAAAASLARVVEESWKDADLLVEDEMYGERWKRGFTLGALVAHEIHHRGQMTVLMRRAGLRVPGTYGPAREAWAAFGMPVPEV